MSAKPKPTGEFKPEQPAKKAAECCPNAAASEYEAATVEPPEAEKQAFVARYVATLSEHAAQEIASLAAAMAPQAKTFDPAALAAQAIALREEVAIAVPARRAALLTGANWYSLSALYWKLADGKSDSEQKRDPHLIAIIEAMKATNAEHTRLWSAHPQRNAEREAQDALLASVASLSGPLPALPCPLESALRWSLSAPEKMPWKKLEAPFIEFLGFCDARRQHEIEMSPDHPGGQRRQDAAEWIERLQGFLSSPTVSPEGRQQHEKEMEGHQAAIAALDANAAYVEDFQPGKPAPAGIKANAKATHATYWRGKDVDRVNVLFFVEDFRPFWEKHGYAIKWQAVHDAQSEAAKQTNIKRNPENAERNPQHWTDETLFSLVKAFAGKHPASHRNPESARAFQVKGRDPKDCGEILGTLYNLRDKPEAEAIASAKEILSHARWRAVPETAFGSSAGTAGRKKSGRFRAGHRGIEVSTECLRECLVKIRY